jgi:hypothetical protein
LVQWYPLSWFCTQLFFALKKDLVQRYPLSCGQLNIMFVGGGHIGNF